MKRLLMLLFLGATAACGEAEVVVRASLAEQPVANLPVWLLPYDRLALTDSVIEAADAPEPVIPDTLVRLVENLAARELEVKARGDTAAMRIRARRQEAEAQIDSIRAARLAWREAVFAGFGEVADKRLQATGLAAKVDTTDASGVAVLELGEGRWWVWSRYVLPDTVLEWNIPVKVAGDSTAVVLTRENARAIPFF